MKEALRLFESTGQRTRVGWEVLITADEEIGSGGSRRLIEEGGAAVSFGFCFLRARCRTGGLVRRRSGGREFSGDCARSGGSHGPGLRRGAQRHRGAG